MKNKTNVSKFVCFYLPEITKILCLKDKQNRKNFCLWKSIAFCQNTVVYHCLLWISIVIHQIHKFIEVINVDQLVLVEPCYTGLHFLKTVCFMKSIKIDVHNYDMYWKSSTVIYINVYFSIMVNKFQQSEYYSLHINTRSIYNSLLLHSSSCRVKYEISQLVFY